MDLEREGPQVRAPRAAHRNGGQPVAPLVGRTTERAAVDGVLATAREGRSGVLILSGEPGVGKTALLGYARQAASGFQTVRAVGVESEGELAFAGLHQLCAPLLGRLDSLPGPQGDALGAAFGLRAATPPEPFLVSLAVLSLLSAAADEAPVLCLIDDAQWLDRASAQVLGFVARRLLAESVAMVFATRTRIEALAELPELELHGLDELAARQLLFMAIKQDLDDGVRDRIIAETQGNPLALLELPRGMTSAELTVGFGLPNAMPVAGRIEESFRRRVKELPAATSRLLLVASADHLGGDPMRVWRAAERLGVSAAAAVPAVEAGLVDVGARLVFRHPLVRSAIYRTAPLSERRAAHTALAQETDPERDPDRHAWHMAAAATGPDEQIASELEQSAGRAQVRGGLAAAAAFLERAAELSPDPGTRVMRQLSAAGAHVMAGANGRAQDVLPSAGQLTDPFAKALALRIEGGIRFANGRGGDTPSLLFDAATALRDLDPQAARESLLESFEAAYWAAQLSSGTSITDVAEAALAIPAPDDDESVANLLLRGYSERLTTGYAAAVPWWRRAVEAHPGELARERRLHWEGLVWNVTGEMLDHAAHAATARRWVAAAREQGALATLPVALNGMAYCELLSGRLHAAEDMTAQAAEITAATGAPGVPGAVGILQMIMLAWRGSDDARAAVEAVTADAVARGQGLGVICGLYSMTVLELGLGRYAEARAAALRVFRDDPLYFGSANLADVVEATVRSGDSAGAEAALERLTERALATQTPWALGLLERARALLAPDAGAEAHYLRAIQYLERAGLAPEVGRSHLLYGEWLRRQRRRRDAREHLRRAHELLESRGIAGFAERARAELQATGEHARTRVDETRDDLTAQERQVARLAADGESNAAIAAHLFISPHTVAYHLRKVYAKLDIGSRNQVARALREHRDAPVG